MPILYNEQDKTITLHTDHTSYQMKVGPCGFLMHTYYGPTAAADMSGCVVFRDRGFSGNPYEVGGKNEGRAVSADTFPLEYPCEGSGDYRAPAFSLRRENGAVGCDLRYTGHSIEKGKYSLPGLPAVYAGEDEAETLLVTLADAAAGVTVTLQYGVLPALDVITRAVRICNSGETGVTLQTAATAALDIASGDWELLHFYGRHAGERAVGRAEIGQREILIGSRRGTSSHQQNPFVILAERGANERYGQCVGMSFLYSGEFSCNVSRDQFGTTRAVMGLQSEHFDYPLAPGEVLQTPEVALAYSGEGLAHLSHLFHRLISQHVCRGPWKNRRRPVLLNNWEATNMDFTGEKILSIARTAAALGVEMLVLDDGWFGARNDAGLGDWVVNREKLGCTMGELAEQIRAMGMKFGLWIEPEMVNEDSDLFRAHPDWAFRIPGKPPVLGRNQLVLDFSRPEVVDGIFTQIAAVLDECKADYVKMDMNRSLSDIYSAACGYQSQGKILHEYVLGVYRFMEKLLERYPDLLLEGCSGGGGRFDAGMLYYCPQIWCSDNTDAIDRIRIQYGTSFCYPLRTMGAHVSAVPNGDTRRITPFQTRGVVAMSGTFGYELDLNRLSDAEKDVVREQIAAFQKYWELIQDGRYYRLTGAGDGSDFTAWEFVARDRSEALLNLVVRHTLANPPQIHVRLKGLDPAARYRIEGHTEIFSGAALMNGGYSFPFGQLFGDYASDQLHFVRADMGD